MDNNGSGKDMVCGMCRYCKGLKETATAKVDQMRGLCKRLPPVVIVTTEMQGALLNKNSQPQVFQAIRSAYPIVMKNGEICGEFKEREEEN